MEYWVLKKKGTRHAVQQGDSHALCGESIKKGERGRQVQYYTQLNCISCCKAFAKSTPPASEVNAPRKEEPVKYISSWKLVRR